MPGVLSRLLPFPDGLRISYLRYPSPLPLSSFLLLLPPSSSFLPPPLSSHFSFKLVKPRGSKEALISTASGKTASSPRLSWWQVTLLRRFPPLSRCVLLPPGRPVYNLRGTSCTTTTITGWASPFPTSLQSTTSCMRQVTRDPMSRICRWVGSSLHILE